MTTRIPPEFLGVGWAFPATTVPPGEVSMAAYDEDVRQAVRIILGTAPGERVMRPDFGAGLPALVFEPMNATTLELARHRVEEALILWEPRIDSIEVSVTADAPVGRLNIEVNYRVRATNTFYNLVYPFYLTEARTP
ncbi:MAG TPA: GPW/gp25 family protein [Gemmatimonadales bacterium]|nr:GPW/gp25 family protein [Gemmatimonadales bacterium]